MRDTTAAHMTLTLDILFDRAEGKQTPAMRDSIAKVESMGLRVMLIILNWL